MSYDFVPQRVAELRERVAVAAASAGRASDDVRLIAVTKTLPVQAVIAAAQAGIADIGENYVQEAIGKQQAACDALGARAADELRWHMIGRVQSNKAGLAARAFSFVHGVDSHSTVRAMARAAPGAADLLVQIKLGGAAVRG
ncbi:MAG TPA: YggS family pyridoxal phosphate-dependent enzyme, partial [Candidatus Binatia bacterium]|nr:YggS family pyridoxal phosphate-dependent enzyme [Candidatus Binatia bacterium]